MDGSGNGIVPDLNFYSSNGDELTDLSGGFNGIGVSGSISFSTNSDHQDPFLYHSEITYPTGFQTVGEWGDMTRSSQSEDGQFTHYFISGASSQESSLLEIDVVTVDSQNPNVETVRVDDFLHVQGSSQIDVIAVQNSDTFYVLAQAQDGSNTKEVLHYVGSETGFELTNQYSFNVSTTLSYDNQTIVGATEKGIFYQTGDGIWSNNQDLYFVDHSGSQHLIIDTTNGWNRYAVYEADLDGNGVSGHYIASLIADSNVDAYVSVWQISNEWIGTQPPLIVQTNDFTSANPQAIQFEDSWGNSIEPYYEWTDSEYVVTTAGYRPHSHPYDTFEFMDGQFVFNPQGQRDSGEWYDAIYFDVVDLRDASHQTYEIIADNFDSSLELDNQMYSWNITSVSPDGFLLASRDWGGSNPSGTRDHYIGTFDAVDGSVDITRVADDYTTDYAPYPVPNFEPLFFINDQELIYIDKGASDIYTDGDGLISVSFSSADQTGISYSGGTGYDIDNDGIALLNIAAHEAPAGYENIFYSQDTISVQSDSGEEYFTIRLVPSIEEQTDSDVISSLDRVFQHVVTVVDDGSGNKYAIDGIQQDALSLVEGETYVFDWSGASGHPFKFSTNADGTHGGGVEYVEGVVVDHVAFTTTITVAEGAPDLYYYCEVHPGMGGSAGVEVSANELIRERMVNEALTDAGTDHLASISERISLGGDAGTTDYTYIDRSLGSSITYNADGTTSGIDFVGNENTFVLDASSEFDFFGYSYDPFIQMIQR